MRNLAHNKKTTMIDKRYELHRTPDAVHQRVGILARKDMVAKTFINYESYIIAIELKSKESIFVIGDYMKENVKEEIADQLKNIVRKIRKNTKLHR